MHLILHDFYDSFEHLLQHLAPFASDYESEDYPFVLVLKQLIQQEQGCVD
jgi:hypothetical protein